MAALLEIIGILFGVSALLVVALGLVEAARSNRGENPPMKETTNGDS